MKRWILDLFVISSILFVELFAVVFFMHGTLDSDGFGKALGFVTSFTTLLIQDLFQIPWVLLSLLAPILLGGVHARRSLAGKNIDAVINWERADWIIVNGLMIFYLVTRKITLWKMMDGTPVLFDFFLAMVAANLLFFLTKNGIRFCFLSPNWIKKFLYLAQLALSWMVLNALLYIQ